MLFTERSRTYRGPKAHSEPEFEYLDRSGRPSAENIRQQLEDWLSRYPEQSQQKLVQRFRSPTPYSTTSATFELFLHELLLRLGYRVELHPRVSPDHDRTPDFLAHHSSGSCFLVEAVLATEEWVGDHSTQARINAVYDKINELQSPDFFLGIDSLGEPKTPPPGSKMKRELGRWLGQLNADDVRAIVEEHGLDAAPRISFAHDGWKIEFFVIPKGQEHRREVSAQLIGLQSGEAKWLSTEAKIRKAVRDKAARYGELPQPYVVAVNACVPHSDRTDVMQALFGSEVVLISRTKRSAPSQQRRRPDGAWFGPRGPRNTRVSGVLVADNLKPRTLAVSNLCLYLNPYASAPCHGAVLQLPRAERAGSEMEWHEGVLPKDLLKLPDGWPGE